LDFPSELGFETPAFSAEKVKDAVEEFFECEFELFVEFTGLIRSVLPPVSLLSDAGNHLLKMD